MTKWIIPFIVSVGLTGVMIIPFFFISIVALNGFTSTRQAFPYFAGFNCVVWPFMTAVVTAVNLVVFAAIKHTQSFWQVALFSAGVVALCLGAFMPFTYVTA